MLLKLSPFKYFFLTGSSSTWFWNNFFERELEIASLLRLVVDERGQVTTGLFCSSTEQETFFPSYRKRNWGSAEVELRPMTWDSPTQGPFPYLVFHLCGLPLFDFWFSRKRLCFLITNSFWRNFEFGFYSFTYLFPWVIFLISSFVWLINPFVNANKQNYFCSFPKLPSD